MKLMIKGSIYLLFSCIALSGAVFAKPAPVVHKVYKDIVYKDVVVNRNHFEVIGGLGAAKLRAGGLSPLGVTSSETDTLVQTNNSQWHTLAAQLGLGYIHYFGWSNGGAYSNHLTWFPSIEPELNLRYLASNSIDGDVWRFQSPAFNQMTFDIPVHSLRLMLDAALTVARWRHLSFYAIGGLGIAHTRIGYHDTDNDDSAPCPNQRLSLNKKTNSKFVWEGGLGLLYDFNDRVGISFEYMWANLGKVGTSSSGDSGTITAPVIVGTNFRLKTQTALLALHIAL